MFEVTLKVRHDCPYTRFTVKHPEVRLIEWCNNVIHVMEVDVPDIETFTRIEPDLNGLLLWKGGRILKKSFLTGNLQLIVKSCRCSKIRVNISEIVERNSCLTIPPETYYGGWEEYRVVGFRENDYRKMFKELDQIGQVKIIQKRVAPEKSIRDTFVVSLNSVFSQLTERQVNSLIAALEAGYYQIPKKVTTTEIAGRSKVPRTTYEEHLRKAESKVLEAIAPYVRLYKSGVRPLEQALEVPARQTNVDLGL
jgi:predicted DNA binding protein